jgi:Cytochrome c554 and c-prime
MKVVVILLLIGALVGVTSASPRDWAGSAKCGSCHPKQLASWQATPHAQTRTRFAAKPEARCLACHGTGEAPAGPAIAVEVGCEACHGAGAAYAADDLMRNRTAALALGLVDLATPKARTALCMQCHSRPTTSRAFDPSAPVHPVKP